METTGHTLLIANMHSRRARREFDEAKNYLRDGGILPEEVYALEDAARLPDIVRDSVRRGASRVILGGGDGSLRSAAPFLVGTSCVLGVLPLGTGNQFARDLDIPLKVRDACRVIQEGRTAAVDIGMAKDSPFLTVATLGVTRRIVESLTDETKKRLGFAAYLTILFRVLPRMRSFAVTLRFGEEEKTFRAIQVVVGNGRYHAGQFPLAPDATITDAKLVVYAVTTTRRGAWLRYLLRLPFGRQGSLLEVPSFEVSSVRVETFPPEKVVLDGEIAAKTPLEFRVAPAALRVFVPADFQG